MLYLEVLNHRQSPQCCPHPPLACLEGSKNNNGKPLQGVLHPQLVCTIPLEAPTRLPGLSLQGYLLHILAPTRLPGLSLQEYLLHILA